MMKFVASVLSLMILFSACLQSSSWKAKEIETKLKQIFPEAKTITVIDAKGTEEAKADSLNMPLPDYKALVSDNTQSNYSFIFYFYNNSINDTSTFGKIFKASMIQNLGVSLGGKKSRFALGMPKYDETGKKLIAYAVSLDLPQEYNVEARDEAIRKIFVLQKIEIKDVKLNAPDQQKKK
jgi:hypothetical protein